MNTNVAVGIWMLKLMGYRFFLLMAQITLHASLSFNRKKKFSISLVVLHHKLKKINNSDGMQPLRVG